MFLSHKGTRRYLKEKLKADIENEAVDEARKFVQTTLDDFCDEALKQHDEDNLVRKALGLREKRRFGKELFLNVSSAFITHRILPVLGESGKSTSTLSSRNDDGMNDKSKSRSKSADCVDGVEVQ